MDTPYFINEKNIDHYPLVIPYSSELGSQSKQGLIFDWLIIVPVAIVLVIIGAIMVCYLVKKAEASELKKRKRGVCEAFVAVILLLFGSLLFGLLVVSLLDVVWLFG